ncbi:MAG: hypothetical protein ACOY94_12550 [Bacillota bacterium]
MHAHPYTSAAFALVTFWAVGVATTVAVADTETGLIRDHPLYGRKLCSVVVPPLAVTGLAVPFLLDGHLLPSLSSWVFQSIPLMLPFAWISWVWSRTWLRRTPAHRRRRLGRITVAVGIIGAVIAAHLALGQIDPPWREVLPMGILFATGALLGSLTNFSLLALTAGLPSEVPGGPAQNLASVTGAGFLMTLLVGGDVLLAFLQAPVWPQQAVVLMQVWFFGSLIIPGLLLLSRLLPRHLPDSLITTAALVFAAGGQFAALLMLFLYPGLVPPIEFGP